MVAHSRESKGEGEKAEAAQLPCSQRLLAIGTVPGPASSREASENPQARPVSSRLASSRQEDEHAWHPMTSTVSRLSPDVRQFSYFHRPLRKKHEMRYTPLPHGAAAGKRYCTCRNINSYGRGMGKRRRCSATQSWSVHFPTRWNEMCVCTYMHAAETTTESSRSCIPASGGCDVPNTSGALSTHASVILHETTRTKNASRAHLSLGRRLLCIHRRAPSHGDGKTATMPDGRRPA